MNMNKSLACQLREDVTYKELLPYERFLRFGPESLTDIELLAIIIRTGTASLTPMQIASEVLSLGGAKEKGLGSLYHISVDELKEIPGIGEVKAVKLSCICELSRRMAAGRNEEQVCFSDPHSIASFYMERLRHEERESVLLLSLNNQMRLLGTEVISIGTVSSALVSTRELFIDALRKGAVHIVVIHNHPGGDPSPSKEDERITQKIASAGKLLDITLQDHIIIGDHSYFSFRERDLL